MATAFSRHWRSLRMFYRSKVWLPRQLDRCLRRLAAKSTPILLGPWLSEVGFELLYWIPLVRKLFHDHSVDPGRVIAVSRGGAAPWYEGIAGRYFDAFECVTPGEFVQANAQREHATGLKKQLMRSPLDETLLAAAVRRFDLADHDVFHPQWMYQLFLGFWSGYAHHTWVLDRCEHARIRPGDRPKLPFPGDYVAVKFYFSSCFPDVPENRAFVRNFAAHLSKHWPVVLLNTGLKVDDHEDSEGHVDGNVFDATPLMTPLNNLAVQTAIVGHARALYCTYGGFSYLGPLLGKPCTSFFSEANFVVDHYDLAHEAFNGDLRHYLAVLPTQAARDLMHFDRQAA